MACLLQLETFLISRRQQNCIILVVNKSSHGTSSGTATACSSRHPSPHQNPSSRGRGYIAKDHGGFSNNGKHNNEECFSIVFAGSISSLRCCPATTTTTTTTVAPIGLGLSSITTGFKRTRTLVWVGCRSWSSTFPQRDESTIRRPSWIADASHGSSRFQSKLE